MSSSITNIISKWSSDNTPSSKYYLIINELLKLYSKFTGKNLINLVKLNDKYDTIGWFIDIETGNIFNVKLMIDKNELNPYEYNKKILEELKTNYYVKITFFLESIKRNFICDKRNIFESINIYEPNKNPEYFRMIDMKSEEIPIVNTRKRSSSSASSSIENTNNKKYKSSEGNVDWSDMVSASSTRNYFLNDPLIDWIKEYNINSINDVPVLSKGNSKGNLKYSIEDQFTKFIMDQGCEFEKKVMEIICKKHKIVQIAESYQSTNVKLFNTTIETMKKGVPIIYQGVLHDYENKTYGAPDIMIRNDYINKFIGYEIYNETFGSPKLGLDWHYVIIDIKHSQIKLTSDGINIRNEESIPAYKGQILIYTQALNNIQGTEITKAFILGKKYIYTEKRINYEINDFMNKLGTIDYEDFDKEYIEKLLEAVKWLRSVRKEGHNWKLLPMPTKSELFPNMNNDKDGMISKIKKELAEEIYEITSIYYCGVKNRKKAFEQGIFGWNDDKCTADRLGINGKNSSRVDAILNINRQNKIIVMPKKIKSNAQGWRKRHNDEMEFFLDFETMNSNFGSIIVDNNSVDYENFNFIFMIGVGFENKNKEWEFKSFIAEEKTLKNEKFMFNKFWLYINQKLKQYKKKTPIFVHWSPAEKTAYNKLKQRNMDLPDINLLDLYQVFLDEPIVIKGALSYSLKAITKALYNNKLINTIWDGKNQCANGLNAMLLAFDIYSKFKKVTNKITSIREIEQYNEIDCKCLWEIINYLRKNH